MFHHFYIPLLFNLIFNNLFSLLSCASCDFLFNCNVPFLISLYVRIFYRRGEVPFLQKDLHFFLCVQWTWDHNKLISFLEVFYFPHRWYKCSPIFPTLFCGAGFSPGHHYRAVHFWVLLDSTPRSSLSLSSFYKSKLMFTKFYQISKSETQIQCFAFLLDSHFHFCFQFFRMPHFLDS